MDPQDSNGPETGDDDGIDDQQQEQQKATETVDFWKQKAREQERRAKANADAKLADIEESQKTTEQKAADQSAKLQAEVDSIPSKVADALREHLVGLHDIDKDDAELFLTGDTPELLLKQVARLAESGKRKSNRAPREGNNTTPPADSEEAAFARDFFGGGN